MQIIWVKLFCQFTDLTSPRCECGRWSAITAWRFAYTVFPTAVHLRCTSDGARGAYTVFLTVEPLRGSFLAELISVLYGILLIVILDGPFARLFFLIKK